LKWIDYASPSTLGEALSLLAEKGDKARVMAGGTDLIVHMRVGAVQPELVVDGKSIPELTELAYNPRDGLTLGAAVPCYRIYQNAEVAKAYPGVIDAASLVGGIQIQGRASFGGNLCNSVPSADTIPAMIAHNATCKIAGPTGTREVPVEEFCTAPRRTVLQVGEMLVSIHFPAPAPTFGARYIRFIPRNEMDIAVAGAGVSVVLNNGTIASARVALAAVAPTPLLVKEAGDALVGKAADDQVAINKAGQIAKDAAKPIDDMRGTVEYRKHLCDVLTRRAVTAAITRAKGGVVDAH
jgi:carbon-monoxide dehydrogenase medium subunit